MTANLVEFATTSGSQFPADHLGKGFRCSATLTDGTLLPCVMLRGRKAIIELAERRIREEGSGKGVFGLKADPSKEMLAHFVTSGNRVNAYDIASVEPSKFAIPLGLLNQIHGETVMAWTGFVFIMKDGTAFSYGTSFSFEFFDVPDGYSFDDVIEVRNHSFVDGEGIISSIHDDTERWRESFGKIKVYREKPFFDCFVDSPEFD
jgi:hypothetical protein